MTFSLLIRGVRLCLDLLWAGTHVHLHRTDRSLDSAPITSPGSPVRVHEPLGNTDAPGID